MAKQGGIVLGWTLSILLLGCSSGSSGGGTGGVSGNGGAGQNGGASGKGGAATTGGASGKGGAATTGGCNIFPADNPWNLDISAYPVHASRSPYLSQMSPTTAFHPDWGTVCDGYGFPFS